MTEQKEIMSVTDSYYQPQNKWYRQRCLLTNFEATLDFSRNEFTFT